LFWPQAATASDSAIVEQATMERVRRGTAAA
jgi:hypothetical protein